MIYLSILLMMFSTLSFGKDFDWQAHRGARGLYPENTINGMKEALKYPVTTLEMDVVISKDGEVVVSHEPWMSAEICLDPAGKFIADKKINLYALDYKEIQKYDCGSKTHSKFPNQKKVKEHKPLLRDLIKEMEAFMKEKGSFKNYSIEIKSSLKAEAAGLQPDYKTFSDKVVKLVQKMLPNERFMIQSFDWRVLRYIHEEYPKISLVALREEPFVAGDIFVELGFVPTVFSPNYSLLKPEEIPLLQSKGVKVIPWTVNSLPVINVLMARGVDGIITDYPNLILEVKTCKEGFNLFEEKCVKIPKNAYPSKNNPGWDCKSGYVQKRSECIKINIPKDAVLLDDGKTWVCRTGFERYRHTCRPIK